MSKYQLSKKQALKLITPVVDGEASEAERKAFMEFIAQNNDVRNKYHSMKKLKSLVKERCPRTKAPTSLRNKVNNFMQEVEEDNSNPDIDPPIYDIPCSGPGKHNTVNITPDKNTSGPKPRYWLFSSAATMLVILALGGFFNIENQSQELPVLDVEEKIYEQSANLMETQLGNDFYMQDTKGNSVVSWKWEGVWFTATSNQEGNKMASGVTSPIATADN